MCVGLEHEKGGLVDECLSADATTTALSASSLNPIAGRERRREGPLAIYKVDYGRIGEITAFSTGLADDESSHCLWALSTFDVFSIIRRLL